MGRKPSGKPWKPHLTVTLAPDLLRQVREQAAFEGRTVSDFVARAIRETIEDAGRQGFRPDAEATAPQ